MEPPTSDTTDLKSGPFGVLYKAVKGNTQVLVNVRNNHKLLGRVKAYDRHMNLWVAHLCWLLIREIPQHLSPFLILFSLLLLSTLIVYNRLLEDVKEMWTEYSKGGKTKKRGTSINKDRYVSKMFLRGDSVILVVSNPAALAAGAAS